MTQTDSRTIVLPEDVPAVEVFGPGDEVLKVIEEKLPGIKLSVRSGIVSVKGDLGTCQLVSELFAELIMAAENGTPLRATAVGQALDLLRNDQAGTVLETHGKTIVAKTSGQEEYLQAISDNPVVFGIGPAGTGKTYLAMAKAVTALLSGQVKRIILTRPAVEAGESLGYLPGSLSEKIDPYLRPLYDALRDMLEPEELTGLLASGSIEVAPLAYMRGRTLSDAFIVLDEAQNTTGPQMKMFLTRLGFNSTMVVTGDLSQIDLPRGQESGLAQAQRVLTDLKDIAFCYLTSADVVRNQLVGRIVDAYERDAHQQNKNNSRFDQERA